MEAGIEIEALALKAMETFSANAHVLAIRRLEFDEARAFHALQDVGPYALVAADPLLFDNEGPVGPSGCEAVVEAWHGATQALAAILDHKAALTVTLGLAEQT